MATTEKKFKRKCSIKYEESKCNEHREGGENLKRAIHRRPCDRRCTLRCLLQYAKRIRDVRRFTSERDKLAHRERLVFFTEWMRPMLWKWWVVLDLKSRFYTRASSRWRFWRKITFRCTLWSLQHENVVVRCRGFGRTFHSMCQNCAVRSLREAVCASRSRYNTPRVSTVTGHWENAHWQEPHVVCRSSHRLFVSNFTTKCFLQIECRGE